MQLNGEETQTSSSTCSLTADAMSDMWRWMVLSDTGMAFSLAAAASAIIAEHVFNSREEQGFTSMVKCGRPQDTMLGLL